MAPIKGAIPVTMLDWPGNVAMMLFVAGCNFRCPYCHNPELVGEGSRLPDLSWGKIARYLEARRGWLDGCVVSGGEPTRCTGIEVLLSRIKELGYPIKIDTNGSSPAKLRHLIDQGLVDCVAMDVKTTLAKYPTAARVPVSEERILESMELLANAHRSRGLEVEFRTTVVPGIVAPEDVKEIASELASLDAPRYVLQQFKTDIVLDESAKHISPYEPGLLRSLATAAGEYLPTTLRGV